MQSLTWPEAVGKPDGSTMKASMQQRLAGKGFPLGVRGVFDDVPDTALVQ